MGLNQCRIFTCVDSGKEQKMSILDHKWDSASHFLDMSNSCSCLSVIRRCVLSNGSDLVIFFLDFLWKMFPQGLEQAKLIKFLQMSRILMEIYLDDSPMYGLYSWVVTGKRKIPEDMFSFSTVMARIFRDRSLSFLTVLSWVLIDLYFRSLFLSLFHESNRENSAFCF